MTTAHTLPSFIETLLDPGCYPEGAETVECLETHISWVLLAGPWAYKIKKPVDFGFLNFGTLALRQFYCHEEIRLNRRLAPALYRDVVAIGGTPERPRLGLEPAFEYAVKMQRFPTSQTLDLLCIQGALQAEHIDALASIVAAFHMALPPSQPERDESCVNKIYAPFMENFHHLKALLANDEQAVLTTLQQASEVEFERCREFILQRCHDGMIRECHGDLHLGNIVLLDGTPVPFDGIEFNADLRWIDVISDVAFLVMDLLHRQRGDLAYRFLDAYLQITGDYAGLRVLRFYLAYRATVRAKVSALRSAQGDEHALQDCRDYLSLAARILESSKPALIITYGLPGSGKTTLSQAIVENLGVVRLRSDVERKRLFGLHALQRPAQADDSLYTSQASERTYGYLLELTARILASGFPVIVDAAFLRRDERRQFQALAESLTIPCVILQVEGDESLIRRRLEQRHLNNRDASDADAFVYETLKSVCEPPTVDEQPSVVHWLNDTDIPMQSPTPLLVHLSNIMGLRLFQTLPTFIHKDSS